VISRTLKLYPTPTQDALLREWWQIGTGVWNWALSQYDQPAVPFIRPRVSCYGLQHAVKGHAVRIGCSAMAMDEIIVDVDRAWGDYRSGLRGKPKRKGKRNRLASIPFRHKHGGAKGPTLRRAGATRVRIPTLGEIKARGWRGLPDATIKTLRIHRRPRGWYATIVLDAEPKAVPLVGVGAVGIDLGFSTLATLSTGEKIEHPREYQRADRRIGQAHRGLNLRLLGRLQQRLALARRSRNHAISRDLVGRFDTIYVSKDNLRAMQRGRWGKSVLSAGHYELRQLLAAKSRQAGRVYAEVSNRNSTRTCSDCGSLTGPTGAHGLRVREWACACGAQHDRDVNAARNTLKLGAVLAHESRGDPASEISAVSH
jgi:putative transposase